MGEFIEYIVGKKFPLEHVVERFSGDGGASLSYNSDDKSLCLYINIPNPTDDEMSAFKNGKVKFALFPTDHELHTSILMIRFADNLIFDLPFDINTLDDDIDGFVEGNAFNMFFMDTETDILKGIRTLGLGSNFMNEINNITINDKRYNSKQYEEYLRKTYELEIYEMWGLSNHIDWDK